MRNGSLLLLIAAALPAGLAHTWDDLPRPAHAVTVVYAQRRVVCRECGVRTERIEFPESHLNYAQNGPSREPRG